MLHLLEPGHDHADIRRKLSEKSIIRSVERDRAFDN